MPDINENRTGYKKTKVGWMPREWEVWTDPFYSSSSYTCFLCYYGSGFTSVEKVEGKVGAGDGVRYTAGQN